MSDQDAFERILASLYDAMLDDTHWPATSALIDEACRIKGSALVVGKGQSQEDGEILFARFCYHGQRYEDREQWYFGNYYPQDERVPRLPHLSAGRLVHITDLYTEQELQTSPAYNEAFPRGGYQHGLNVRLDGPDESHIIWTLADSTAPGGWESPQLTLIQGLLPHIRQFVRVRQALVSAEALGAAMTDLLDSSRLGVIHLDQRGRIVVANDRARAMLRRGDGITDLGGVLRARLPADHARLERLLAGALPTSSAPAVSGSMTLRRTAVLLPFVVYVRPVVGRQPDFGARRVAALVLLVEPGRSPRIDPALVAATLGLTPAESHVAVWLAEGQSVRQIAVATERTEAAIHYHLHQIYQKLQIARQGDLIRLVLSLAEVV